MEGWKPSRLKGGTAGIAMIFSVLALDGLLLFCLTDKPVTLLSFLMGLLVALSLPILTALGYLLYGLFNLRYLLNRNGLVIVWAMTRQIIPLSSITRVVRGEDIGQKVRMRGINWPGYHIGRGEIEGLGPVLFYSTRLLEGQLLLVTPTLTYGISPSDPEGFLADFEIRRRLGPIRSLQQGFIQARFLTLPIWTDRMAHLLLAVGSIANAALFAYICSKYPALDLDARGEALNLSAIGLVVMVLNSLLGFWIFDRERLATYLLFAAAILIQVLLWVATINIIH